MSRPYPIAIVAATLALPLPALAQEGGDVAQVTISARKREERLVEVPVAVTSFSRQALDDYNIRSFNDYATKVPNLSFAYGNGTSAGETGTAISNARTIAIRGIAGARTTGYYLDDIALPGAVDARVLDLQAIEILKGPQGTLFGESSLGGTVRLISVKPSLVRNEVRAMLEGGSTRDAGSALNGGTSAVANVVLAPGSAALRLSAFAAHDAGYLSRTYLSDIADPASARIVVGNQAASSSAGGAITALLRVRPELDLTLRLIVQRQHYHGFPASYAPLPAFEPVPVIEHSADIQPESNDSWSLPSLSAHYQGANWSVDSATSYFHRKLLDTEDSTEGTAQYLASYGLGQPPPQPFAWTAHRANRQFSHETRINIDPAGPLSAVAGVYFARFKSARDSAPVYGQDVLGLPGRSLLWIYANDNNRKDASLFGELYYRFLDQYTLTLGLRKYWLSQDDHTQLDGALYGVNFVSDTASKASGSNPKLALAYQHSANAMFYASAGKGFRAGGSQADLTPFLGGCISPEQARRLAQVAPDSLWSYELGAKLDLPEPGLIGTAAVYHIDWRNIQQPAFIPTCAFYLLGNAGAAKIDGAELELSGRLSRSVKLRAGFGYQHARITEQGSSQQPAGSRIKQVPTWTATVGAVYERALTPGLRVFAAGDISYVGASVSSNSTALALERPAYRLLNLRVGLGWDRSQLSLDVGNAGNARPNLGDVGYLGYQRFEADGTTPIPQVATMPPRRIMLQYRRQFL